jgi:hypothetical protein
MITTADQQSTSHDHRQVWTEQRIRALGAVTDIPTAGQILGIGRGMSYQLARTHQFPVPLIPIGTNRYRVPVTGILAALGFPATTGDLTAAGQPSVDHHQEIRTIDVTPVTDRDQGEP